MDSMSFEYSLNFLGEALDIWYHCHMSTLMLLLGGFGTLVAVVDARFEISLAYYPIDDVFGVTTGLQGFADMLVFSCLVIVVTDKDLRSVDQSSDHSLFVV